jgi:hypothetical protein
MAGQNRAIDLATERRLTTSAGPFSDSLSDAVAIYRVLTLGSSTV